MYRNATLALAMALFADHASAIKMQATQAEDLPYDDRLILINSYNDC